MFTRSTGNMFHDDETTSPSLSQNMCQRWHWQQDGMPCYHAVAAFNTGTLGQHSKEGTLWWDFAFDDIYMVKVYKKALGEGPMFLPQREDLVHDGITKPPTPVKLAGHPMKRWYRRARKHGGPPRLISHHF